MSRIEKRLEKFCNPASKQEIPKSDLESILNHYFPEQWTYGQTRGSHNYKITHPEFKLYPQDYGDEGELVIPVKGGQKVKHFYLKDLCKAIKRISKESEKTDEEET